MVGCIEDVLVEVIVIFKVCVCLKILCLCFCFVFIISNFVKRLYLMVKNNVYKIYKLYIIKLVYNDWIVLSKVYKKIVEYLNCRLLNCL